MAVVRDQVSHYRQQFMLHTMSRLRHAMAAIDGVPLETSDGGAVGRPGMLKPRLRKRVQSLLVELNAALDCLCETHSTWSSPSLALRAELQVSLDAALMPPCVVIVVAAAAVAAEGREQQS